MKQLQINILLITVLLTVTALNAQQNQANYQVYFKQGIVIPDANLSSLSPDSLYEASDIQGNNFYRYIQFYAIPTQEQMREMERSGIKLLEYIPQAVYVAAIPVQLDFNQFKLMNIRSIWKIPVAHKMDARLEIRPFPDWVLKGDKIRLIIQYYGDIELATVQAELTGLQINIIENYESGHALIVQLSPDAIGELALKPFVRYLEFENEPGVPESDDGRNLHRSNAIDVEYFGGYDYDGTGVSVAINDDGFVGPHIDFKGRADQSDVIGDMEGSHGDMTVGIVGAAGNVNPLMRGMAPGAFLWVRNYSSSLPNTLSLHQNSSVMIFSSSYSDGCNAGYTSVTQMVDEQINDNPGLIQVFSAGNSNDSDCGYGAGNQWGNITGGHKMGKNVLTTANLYSNDMLAQSSSRGPASDGRIKPDISAHGQGHWSTYPDHAYAAGGGTSAAAPGIAGVLAQLHQAYRELNNGNNAPSALLKAALLNTANDLGNPGPDFKYGWGKVNAYKALKTIEQERYLSNSITQSVTNNHVLSVPAGVQEMRVMVYWHDVEASTAAAQALVNNLNMTIFDPFGLTHLPLVLDHTPNAVTLNNPAAPGIDSINNVEQIRISNPAAGNYSIHIQGASIPFGPQTYYLVYEYILNDIRVTYPIGGESLLPGSSDRIHWDAYGNSGTFTAEYSLDGISWSLLADNISGDARFIDFTVPDTVSHAKIRISRGTVSDMSDEYFSIIQTPDNVHVSSICANVNMLELQLEWNSVPNADSYDIFRLGSVYMDSVGHTSNLSYSLLVPDTNEEYWFSVRARGPGGVVGQRALAIKVDGNGCYLNCNSNADVGVASLISPASSAFGCGSSSLDITVNLTNLGSTIQSGFLIYYQLDNNMIVEDTFTNTLGGGMQLPFTFSIPVTPNYPGFHTLLVWTDLPNDGAPCNDTLNAGFQYFEPIVSYPYQEDFEGADFPPLTIQIINPDAGLTWEKREVTGSDGSLTNAAYINNYAYNSSGQEDFLSLLSFDLTNTSFAELSFDLAYTPYATSYVDGLRIDVSTNCGQSFTPVYYKSGSALATLAGPTSASWAPDSASHWRRDTVDLSTYTGNYITVRFVSITGYGNNLYLDQIELKNSNLPTYCIPVSNCTVGDEIDDFMLNTINQVGTGCGTDGYSNFLAYATSLEKGQTYNLTVSTNYSNQFVSVWIDLNNDLIFDNTTERLLFDFNLPAVGIQYSAPLTIPSGANVGAHRMRVRARWSASCNDPCATFSYGETHDYTVIIIDPIPQVPQVWLGSGFEMCQGDVQMLSPQVWGGEPPYSYAWSTGETTESILVNPLVSSNYSLTVSDANLLMATDEVAVTVHEAPLVNLGADLTLLQGYLASLDAGSGFETYLWNTGETTQQITVSLQGIYSVTVTNANFCSGEDEIQLTVINSPGPGWFVGNTSNFHVIHVPSNASITIDGVAIETGDYIGVFYDSLGTLACGGFLPWTGTTGSLVAWGAEFGNDGFIPNEAFTWKIWKYSTGMEFNATASYIPTPMPNAGNFVSNGLSGILSLEAIIPAMQTLQLIQGWSIISSYIQADNPLIDTIFAPVASHVIILKDGDGSVYWPLWNLNLIGDLDPTEGYQLKMSAAQVLEIYGVAVNPTTTLMNCPAGWSILSYLHPYPANILLMLSPIYSSIIIVKDGAGHLLWPLWEINEIGTMHPGKGYQILLSNPQNFTYPAL